MHVIINNSVKETAATNVSELLAELGLPADGTAVGLNGCIVPRAKQDMTSLTEGCILVIIKAACGG